MKNLSEVNELVEHFFRHEAGKMIAVLTKIFGSHDLMRAEDIVQDTLVEAISNWTYKGIPNNPEGWLYTVAKNKILNVLKREEYRQKYTSEYATNSYDTQNLDEIFSDDSISDDQLRMMFMCSHPSISEDSQVALILKTLCGFSINEIAKAFLANSESVNKRLVRARRTIRENRISFAVPPMEQLDKRVDAVLEALYLLFNEGYSASKGANVIREKLCQESIRLTQIIVAHQAITNKSNPLALLALMQLNTSRFIARQDANGNILTLSEQDRSTWDYHVMEQGFSNLKKAAESHSISKYHILAAISAYHCSAKDFRSTNWKGIVALYERLLTIDNSPIVVLNYAISLSKVGKIEKALQELNAIEKRKEIKSNHLYYATKAELHLRLNQETMAKKTLERAIKMAPLSKERELLEGRFEQYFGKKGNGDVPVL